jgi:hypothetical protein
MAPQPISGLGLLNLLRGFSWGTVTAVFYGVGLLALRPTPNLEDQFSIFMSPGDRVAQLYPRALGSSGTSGVPLPVPTMVGPWGEDCIIINLYFLGCRLKDFKENMCHNSSQIFLYLLINVRINVITIVVLSSIKPIETCFGYHETEPFHRSGLNQISFRF